MKKLLLVLTAFASFTFSYAFEQGTYKLIPELSTVQNEKPCDPSDRWCYVKCVSTLSIANDGIHHIPDPTDVDSQGAPIHGEGFENWKQFSFSEPEMNQGRKCNKTGGSLPGSNAGDPGVYCNEYKMESENNYSYSSCSKMGVWNKTFFVKCSTNPSKAVETHLFDYDSATSHLTFNHIIRSSFVGKFNAHCVYQKQ